jgi:hypothetical protein
MRPTHELFKQCVGRRLIFIADVLGKRQAQPKAEDAAATMRDEVKEVLLLASFIPAFLALRASLK